MTDASPRLTPFLLSKAALSALIILPPVLWVLNVPRQFGVALYTEQVVVFVFGAALGLCYLSVDRHGHTDVERPAWYDVALSTLVLISLLI